MNVVITSRALSTKAVMTARGTTTTATERELQSELLNAIRQPCCCFPTHHALVFERDKSGSQCGCCHWFNGHLDNVKFSFKPSNDFLSLS